ncbi:MAG: flavin reductase family protein [Chitinophagaceae bacterium]|nr:flavin reductase family protein [Chitinophagaceae bacterium]
MEINVPDHSSLEVYHHLTHLIAPRPIALVSTISRDGVVNLSPFSFFNLFSSNPPIVIFSPLRRMRDNTVKHTLHNVMEVPEVVINIVTKDISGQTSLASAEYGDGIDEFIKAGFGKQKAMKVKPPMVKEAKAKLECKVIEIKPLGAKGGAGNLVICEVIYIHMDDEIVKDGQVDPAKLNLAARLGSDWYSEINTENIFTLNKPKHNGIGIDNLPAFIRNSTVLTGNNLARLASIDRLPDFDYSSKPVDKEIFEYVIELLNKNEVQKAWQVLLNAV